MSDFGARDTALSSTNIIETPHEGNFLEDLSSKTYRNYARGGPTPWLHTVLYILALNSLTESNKFYCQTWCVCYFLFLFSLFFSCSLCAWWQMATVSSSVSLVQWPGSFWSDYVTLTPSPPRFSFPIACRFECVFLHNILCGAVPFTSSLLPQWSQTVDRSILDEILLVLTFEEVRKSSRFDSQ